MGGETNIVQAGSSPGNFTNRRPNLIRCGRDLTNASRLPVGGAKLPGRFQGAFVSVASVSGAGLVVSPATDWIGLAAGWFVVMRMLNAPI